MHASRWDRKVSLTCTETGIEMARTVRRKIESEAFDHRKILAIRATPWDRKVMQETMPSVDPDAKVVPQEHQVDPPGLEARRAYIYKADIEEAGYSDNCPGCRAMMLGKTQQAHSEASHHSHWKGKISASSQPNRLSHRES